VKRSSPKMLPIIALSWRKSEEIFDFFQESLRWEREGCKFLQRYEKEVGGRYKI